MVRYFALLFTILLILIVPVLSQSTSDWQIILENISDGQVYRITSDDASVVEAPSSPQASNFHNSTIAFSMDGRYMAYMDDNLDVYITDTITGECCRSVPNPFKIEQLEQGSVTAVNPDGTAVAFTWSNWTNSIEGQDFIGGVMVSDVEGNITHLEDICRPFIGYWLPEGIEVALNCLGGDAYQMLQHMLWQPETGWNGESYNDMDAYGNYLTITGEKVRIDADLNFPYDSNAQLHGYFNVVYYEQSPDSEQELIYVAMAETHLASPHWVADGRAFMLHGYRVTQADLIYRDGYHDIISFENPTNLIAGTPDGWVSVDDVTGEVLHYIVGNNHDVQMNRLGSIGSLNDFHSLIYQPRLGTSITELGFASVPQILVTLTPTHCSNNLDFNLAVGDSAFVVPGSANNVRNEPSSTSELIGQIPSGEYFIVIDGPICANNMAWWKIEYNGLIGWTPEGQAGEYWLEPYRG